MKTVKQIFYAHEVDMGGIPVRQPIPTRNVEQIDPFLLVHCGAFEVKPGTDHRNAGIGPHPHRGFSPVSFIFDGSVHHRDSRGNSNEVHAGGVQWMNAGMGIIHSERPGKEFAKKGGVQQMVQLWVNTPAEQKMDQPYYLAANKEDMPTLELHSGEGTLQLVSGEQQGKSGSVQSPLPLLAIMGYLKAGVTHSFDIPSNRSTILLVLEGDIRIEGHGLVEELNLIHFSDDGDSVGLEVKSDAKILLLAGEPINEPLAQHGPFVMNNQTQIMEAFRDYQMGKMGILIEEFD